MAWDIYGNPLQRGHCEVHPHVHEEYPCSVCMSERGQTQQPHDALQQLQYEFAQQGDYIKQLEAERDALAAQVEALRSAIEPFATGGVCSAINREDYSIMRERIKDWHGVTEFKKAQDAYNSTPQQCLLDVQAEAGRAGFIEGYDSCWFQHYGTRAPLHSTTFPADQYADSVRKGGAE